MRLTGAPNSFERGREVLSASDLEREIWRGQVLARLQSAVLAGMKTLEAGEAWRVIREVHARGQMIETDASAGCSNTSQTGPWYAATRMRTLTRFCWLRPLTSSLNGGPNCGDAELPRVRSLVPAKRRPCQLYHEPVCRHRELRANARARLRRSARGENREDEGTRTSKEAQKEAGAEEGSPQEGDTK